MLKIKIFNDNKALSIDATKEVNDFIKDKEVVDIKYSRSDFRDNFMVIYKG